MGNHQQGVQYMATNTQKSSPRRNNNSRQAFIIDPNDPLSTAKSFCRARTARLIRYRGAFYTWADTHYRQVDDEAIRKEVYDFLAAAACKPDDRAVNKVIDAMKANAFVSSDLHAPAWLPSASPEQTEHAPTDLLACANGLLDLNAGVPLPITSSFLTMNAVDYAYDPMAECPRWEKFIADVLPNDADAQRELRKAFGYALSGDTSQQKIFGFFGKPRSGQGYDRPGSESITRQRECSRPEAAPAQKAVRIGAVDRQKSGDHRRCEN
jgi:putative DNA primase/helicase